MADEKDTTPPTPKTQGTPEKPVKSDSTPGQSPSKVIKKSTLFRLKQVIKDDKPTKKNE